MVTGSFSVLASPTASGDVPATFSTVLTHQRFRRIKYWSGSPSARNTSHLHPFFGIGQGSLGSTARDRGFAEASDSGGGTNVPGSRIPMIFIPRKVKSVTVTLLPSHLNYRTLTLLPRPAGRTRPPRLISASVVCKCGLPLAPAVYFQTSPVGLKSPHHWQFPHLPDKLRGLGGLHGSDNLPSSYDS